MTQAAGTPGERVWAVVPCHSKPPPRQLLDQLLGCVSRILVVEDGLRDRGPSRPDRVESLRIGDAPQGKGHAVAAALEYVRMRNADAVLVVDGDGQHPGHVVRALLEAGTGAELVIGDRSADAASMPRPRRVANAVTNALLTLVTGTRVRDSQCGLRLLRGRALTEIEFPRGGYEAETQHLKACLRAGVTVAWVPIPAVYGGEASSFRPLRDGARVLWAVISPARRKPKLRATGSDSK